MNLQDEVKQLRESLKRSEHIQVELDRRVFHLKTLYDVSRDIFGTVDFEIIVKNFLLMTMGNFGVMKGFVLTLDAPSGKVTHFVSMGFHTIDPASLQNGVRQCLLRADPPGPMENAAIVTGHRFFDNIRRSFSRRRKDKNIRSIQIKKNLFVRDRKRSQQCNIIAV